jgi:hypothetical protein
MFMGHAVTIVEPELDADDFPKGSDPRVTVCVESVPQRQCYTSPTGYARNPKVSVVQVQKNIPALFLSVESWGVSGWPIHFGLLRPGIGKDLEDLFRSGVEVSNQNQHAFWTDSTISAAPIFVVADFKWGPDEGHYGDHRYIISAYVSRYSQDLEGDLYYLNDQFMTSRKYDLDDKKTNILDSEKLEILARLRRAKAVSERKPQAPR